MIACGAGCLAQAGYPTKPVLFVTQVPMPEETNARVVAQIRQSCASPIQNPLGDTASAGRGGALMIYYPAASSPATTLGTVVNLTAKAGFGVVNASGLSTGLQAGANAIAVQHPFLHWSGTKAIFSMVAGGPASLSDTTTFYWQLYEITNFDKASVTGGTGPIITKVPNQPNNYNHLHACYGTDERIIFTSDHPRGNLTQLYPQRDEYLLQPISTGLSSLDPTQPAPGNLFQIAHMPSGAFDPFIDSFGRLIFVQWDHLSRDPIAVDDKPPIPANGDNWTQTFNGTGDFTSEAANATFTPGTNDQYPEPRNFDKTSLLSTSLNGHNVVGNSFNFFFLWMINEDGSNHEIINHMGRQELHPNGLGQLAPGVDPNLVAFDATAAPARTFINQMLAFVESPLTGGLYYGIDGPDIGAHGAGQIVSLTGSPGLNPDQTSVPHMTLSYVGPTTTAQPKPSSLPAPNPVTGTVTPLATPIDTYRTVCPLSDGSMLASWSGGTRLDGNKGTAIAPLSYFDFRLKSLKQGTGTAGIGLVPDQALTSGINAASISWYNNGQTISYNGPLWELDPVEVIARTKPARINPAIDPVEQQVFTEEGVDSPTFQTYLRTRNLALVISRDVTHRDRADKQQPYNLRITGTTHQTVANAGTLYDVSWLQIFQADGLRSFTNGGATPVAGRRVLAQPLHDSINEMPTAAGAPPGSVKLGVDGSFAAVLPARKAVSWHLTNGNGATTESIVKERFWVNFAPGEVRTCANCHGINTIDQSGATKPVNKPNALRDLLQFWKAANPPGSMQHSAASLAVMKNGGPVLLHVKRTAGSTGPVSVTYSLGGSALAGVDYTSPAVSTLSWADGDTADKIITLPLLNPSTIGASKTVVISLGTPVNGSVGAQSSTTLTIAEPPFQSWQYSHFTSNANTPAVADDTADPDHDGVANLLEYALNADPNQPSPSALPVVAHGNLSGTEYLALTYLKDLSKTDIIYQAQVSDSLAAGSWSDISDDLMSTADSIETRRAKIALGSGQQFLRLQITRP
ncbi:MAG: hypothetical protein JWO94_2599 [Verrucomicrobiaceae bacterium]|nr:hypothetical protein [Verrucomicrobiaceae bacterium]